MNYTSKHHLPQWEKTDRILMEDFNLAMANIETGLSSAGDGAASAAAKAQASADSALAKANAAQASANKAYSPTNKPFTAGTYSGNGATLSLYLGFRPSFLILTNQSASPSQQVSQIAVVGPGGNLNTCVTLTSSGAEIVNPPSSGTASTYPRMNNAGQTYSYIAFR